MSCFVHTLQLVVSKFSKVRLCSATIKKAHGLVKKVNKSTKATELLIQYCGKKLVKIAQLAGVTLFCLSIASSKYAQLFQEH